MILYLGNQYMNYVMTELKNKTLKNSYFEEIWDMCQDLKSGLMFIFLLMILGKTNCCAPIFVFKQQVSKKSNVIYWAFGLDHYQNGWLLVQVSSPRKKHGFVDTATRGLWKAQEIFESKSSEICYVSWKLLSNIITKEIINEMSLYHLT